MSLPEEPRGQEHARLARSFFGRPAEEVAPQLLNKILLHGDRLGRIVEVEAYGGEADPASHAFRGRTPRNATMFGPPGHLYVYFTYGMHHCANLVCGEDGQAAAVLLRGVTPLAGLRIMRAARSTARTDAELCAGPGRTCMAFGLDCSHDGADMVSGDLKGPLVVSDGLPPPSDPGVSGRIGLSVAREALWRFYVPGARGVSR